MQEVKLDEVTRTEIAGLLAYMNYSVVVIGHVKESMWDSDAEITYIRTLAAGMYFTHNSHKYRGSIRDYCNNLGRGPQQSV